MREGGDQDFCTVLLQIIHFVIYCFRKILNLRELNIKNVNNSRNLLHGFYYLPVTAFCCCASKNSGVSPPVLWNIVVPCPDGEPQSAECTSNIRDALG